MGGGCHFFYYFTVQSHLLRVWGSSIILEVVRTVIFFYQDILHKDKTPKYVNTPKKHNKAHSLGRKCPDKIADKKIINNFLFKNKM